jgi:3-hydroxyacyl-CoA dehydrogenase
MTIEPTVAKGNLFVTDDNQQAPVGVEINAGIAIVRVDNPPVNALSQAVRQGLKDAVTAVAADETVSGAVLICTGRTFIAGADIREFGKAPMEPLLPDVITLLEASQKPWLAAIHGTALGGGLEITLGCHYRVLHPSAQVGLPEVSLGIIPGAGGTQRLPRLIGFQKAVDIITSGRRVTAREAVELGIGDAIADGDLETTAIAYLRDRLATSGGHRVTSQMPAPTVDGQTRADLRAKVEQKARGQMSPVTAFDAVVVATELPFAQGVKRERELFGELVVSDQSKALRYAFFGQRAVTKIPGLEGVKPLSLNAIGVIGAGTMGAAITAACITAGLPVTIVEHSQEAARTGRDRIAGLFEGRVKRGAMSRAAADEILSRVTMTTQMETLRAADLIIEAVFEDMALKKDVFSRLDAIAKPDAVLATNTSYLNVDEIAAATVRPSSVVGLHFFAPAHVTRLLEIVRGQQTSSPVLATAMALAKRLKKVGVVAAVCDGFIGNRILSAYGRQVDYMVEDGAWPEEIDAAMEAFGMALGPFKVFDMSGLDIGWLRRKANAATRDPQIRISEVADRICEGGNFGQKTGAGYYLYQPGSRVPKTNPQVRRIIDEVRAQKGIVPQSIAPEDIQLRVLAAMVNSAAKIVEENIAFRPVDVDQVMLHGYGYPAWRGGPLFQADLIGLPEMATRVADMCRAGGAGWSVSRLLVDLARSGGSFAQLNEK